MNEPHNVPVPSSALTGLHHVRLTVTRIERSKAFYSQLLGIGSAIDFTSESRPPYIPWK